MFISLPGSFHGCVRYSIDLQSLCDDHSVNVLTLTSRMSRRFVVIGAGVSGSFCAHTLSRATGAAVSVFEMGRGAGGRCSSRRTRSSPGLYVDHGCRASMRNNGSILTAAWMQMPGVHSVSSLGEHYVNPPGGRGD